MGSSSKENVYKDGAKDFAWYNFHALVTSTASIELTYEIIIAVLSFLYILDHS